MKKKEEEEDGGWMSIYCEVTLAPLHRAECCSRTPCASNTHGINFIPASHWGYNPEVCIHTLLASPRPRQIPNRA